MHAMWFSDGQRNFREIFIVLMDDILAIVRVPLYGIIKITFTVRTADIFIKSPNVRIHRGSFVPMSNIQQHSTKVY